MVIGGYPLNDFESDTCRPINDDPAIALVTVALKKIFRITGI
jgi:hypothetical protein